MYWAFCDSPCVAWVVADVDAVADVDESAAVLRQHGDALGDLAGLEPLGDVVLDAVADVVTVDGLARAQLVVPRRLALDLVEVGDGLLFRFPELALGEFLLRELGTVLEQVVRRNVRHGYDDLHHFVFGRRRLRPGDEFPGSKRRAQSADQRGHHE